MNLDKLAEFIINVERICKWNVEAFSAIAGYIPENGICDVGIEQNAVLIEACKLLTETKKDEIIN